jgi:hypothetical protein
VEGTIIKKYYFNYLKDDIHTIDRHLILPI